MQPHTRHSHTRLVLHALSDLFNPSDLFNGRAGLACMVGVLLASEPLLLLTDRVELEGPIFRKKPRYRDDDENGLP
jgi:hypothetical protein